MSDNLSVFINPPWPPPFLHHSSHFCRDDETNEDFTFCASHTLFDFSLLYLVPSHKKYQLRPIAQKPVSTKGICPELHCYVLLQSLTTSTLQSLMHCMVWRLVNTLEANMTRGMWTPGVCLHPLWFSLDNTVVTATVLSKHLLYLRWDRLVGCHPSSVSNLNLYQPLLWSIIGWRILRARQGKEKTKAGFQIGSIIDAYCILYT